jgi:hypothetical protein
MVNLQVLGGKERKLSTAPSSRALETEQPQKPEPQIMHTTTKVSGFGRWGKRPGAGRKKKRIPEHESSSCQTVSQPEHHSVQVEKDAIDSSDGGSMHMVDAGQQQQQQLQLEPRLTTTQNTKVRCGGKRLEAGNKKMQLDGPASPLEKAIAQHQGPSLLHSANRSIERAVDPPKVAHLLHSQESEERIPRGSAP